MVRGAEYHSYTTYLLVYFSLETKPCFKDKEEKVLQRHQRDFIQQLFVSITSLDAEVQVTESVTLHNQYNMMIYNTKSMADSDQNL